LALLFFIVLIILKNGTDLFNRCYQHIQQGPATVPETTTMLLSEIKPADLAFLLPLLPSRTL